MRTRVLDTFAVGVRKAEWQGLRLAVLCIGVSAYASQHEYLDNAVRDAEAVYEAVNAIADCRAAIIRDPADKNVIRTHLRKHFLQPLAESPPEVVLIFVAGHGLQRGHNVYVIPSKASSEDATDLEEECLSHLKLFEWLKQFLDAPAKEMLKRVKFVVIMDVCRVSVPFESSANISPLSIDPEAGKAPEKLALCYSTARGGVASDGDKGSHSPLALGLLDAQKGIFAAGVSLKQGIENACAAVRESTKQRPITISLDEIGDYMLKPMPAHGCDTQRDVLEPLLVDVLCEVGVIHMDHCQVTRRGAPMKRLWDWAVSADGAHRIAVVGQGGSGKSTLAHCFLAEVGRELVSSIRLVFFLQAGDMMRGYRQLLKELKRMLRHSGPEPVKDEEVRAQVHMLLRSDCVKNKWIGVLDDLPSPVDTDSPEVSWLMDRYASAFPWGYGKTIVTSRSAEWVCVQHVGNGFTVSNFEVEEAHAYLKGMVHLWSEDEKGVAEVARRLSYFPLALASAAGWCFLLCYCVDVFEQYDCGPSTDILLFQGARGNTDSTRSNTWKS